MSFYDYCKEHVAYFEPRFEFALTNMDHWRCPLEYADSGLYGDLEAAAEDYCDDYGLDIDEFDIEEEIMND